MVIPGHPHCDCCGEPEKTSFFSVHRGNANPRDVYGTPGPYEDAVQNTPIFEENGPENFKGIDIMRAVRSFDPCLPCGVHAYLGEGKVLKQMHTPTALLGMAKCGAVTRRPT